MRMDRSQTTTAADLVMSLSAEELARIFWEYGGERDSRRLAKGMERERLSRPIRTTGELAGLIEKMSPRRGKKSHPATKVFQALRIAVNGEMSSFERGLAGGLKILKSGGRLAGITVHLPENRKVNKFWRRPVRH